MSATPDPSAAPQATTDDLQILCPFCNNKVETELYNGTYGCDTGCDYVRFEVRCPSCHRGIYSTGCFGSFAETADDERYMQSKESYHRDFMEDFAEAVQRIHQRRMAKEAAESEGALNADQ